jgi:hypothetical protein
MSNFYRDTLFDYLAITDFLYTYKTVEVSK